MRLDGNRLSGEIPASFADLPNLETLWLHDNDFTGCTPSALEGLVTTGRGELPGFCTPPEHPEERTALVALYEATGGADHKDEESEKRKEKLEEWKSEEYGLAVPPLTHTLRACIENFDDLWTSGELRLGQLRELRILLWQIREESQRAECFNGVSLAVAHTVDELDELIDQGGFADYFSWSANDNWLIGEHIGNWHGVTVDEDTGHVINLELSDNNLDGSIPSELIDLAILEHLNLSRNNLYGNIPQEISDLGSLERLDLSFNDLSGSIPSALYKLGNLTYLNLSSNDLTGKIPWELGWMIPSEGGYGGSLENMYLFDNNLSGCIPRKLLEPLEGGLETAEEALVKYEKSPFGFVVKEGTRFLKLSKPSSVGGKLDHGLCQLASAHLRPMAPAVRAAAAGPALGI